VERNSDRVSGAWVFKGTRVPVKALFDNLEEGASVDDFLKWLPSVAMSTLAIRPTLRSTVAIP